ncbi:MAG: YihY family inner membrane protein [Gammaproteobacteria bacterium]|nr:YihY family inner membrane protein [Gammaproteobacteria bacterium]
MPNDAVVTAPLQAWRYCRWFLRQIATQFRDDGCTAAAAALTFTTMIAVVPFVAIIYRILSLLPEFDGVGDKITSFVFETFLPGSSDAVLEKVLEFSAKANELTLVGIGVVFVTTMLMLMRMEESFNRIWHVANTRAGLTRFLSYWGIISFGVPMIGVAVTAASYDGIADLAELRGSALMDVLREAVPPIATALTFTFLYYGVPSCRVRFPHALVGGVVTTILLAVAKEAFARVVPLFQNDLVYGAFAALPLFVMGLYLVWVMILVGAICARTLSLIPWEDEPDGVPAAIKCARVLALLHNAHLDGGAVTDADILRAVPMTRTERARIFDVLNAGRWLRPTSAKTWALGRGLSSMTLWELFLALPDDIAEENLGGDSAVEERFRAFLADGAVHLDVTLDKLNASHVHPKDAPTD